jgi:PilZ domain
MTTPPVRVERRIGQRFPYLLPVSFREPGTSLEGLGFTQDVSSRGVFFFTDAPLREGAEIELTLKMPSEITLGNSMRVRCRGRILRVVRSTTAQDSSSRMLVASKVGVSVVFDNYEYLPESEHPESSCVRMAALHPHHEAEETPLRFSGRAVQG